ncbi:DUF916 domain-containing protein [Fructilactobacillus carniphilus]|uniref:DUF916 and DUF3324 domain-containing protein n=1 Tax=Fructilactobacillus carniphilus TaxID=2940297 RepID=A0ABY5BX29_9LACO|nr:DUF916 domain-containing protein [Fructilactobacillus carniphilus]USS90359.1 DUF916 and DUF3324 domain-containing protein [Fructilactobacillus carniphilus]
MISKHHKLKLLLGVAFFSFLFTLLAPVVHATPGPGVAVKPNYPATEIERGGSFFFKTKPGEPQTITMDVANLANYSQTLRIEPTTAYTSKDGAITYNPGKVPHDKTLKYKMRDLIKEKKQVITVGANKTKQVSFTVVPPKKDYKGIILGALYVKTENKNDNVNANNININNKMALVMPVMIKSQDKKVNPKLTALSIKPNKSGSQTIINTKLANERPTTIQGLQIKDRIYRKGNPKKTLSKNKLYQLSMAPNSNFQTRNDFGKNALLPGTYHLSLRAHDENGNHWKIEKDFTVSIKDSVIYNNNNWWWIALLIALLLIILLLLYLIYRQKKKQKELLQDQEK